MHQVAADVVQGKAMGLGCKLMHTKLQFRQRITDPRADQVLISVQLQTKAVFRRTKIRRELDTNSPEILRNIALKMPGVRRKVLLGV